MLRLVKKELNIFMTQISPKVIDVEGCRVATDDILWRPSYIEKNYGDNMKKKNSKVSISYASKNGRFPTQLFTNIKNNQYKYVKNIT